MRQRIVAFQRSAAAEMEREPIRWVAEEALHLTLRFLGPTPQDQLDLLRSQVEQRSGRWRAFRLRLARLGCFPDERRPRVLWVAADDPSRALEAMAADLESLARAGGFEPEVRPFSPHLTLARVKAALSVEGRHTLGRLIADGQGIDFGEVPVGRIGLIRSDLRPSGPVYRELAGFDLPGAVPA